MVRYPRGHKERTREQILEAAAQAFREEGVTGVSVGELMSRAGLTHGGFYAHFASKDAVLAEACRCAMDQAAGRVHQRALEAPPGERTGALVDAYVNARHRDEPGLGCIVPSLSGEMPRQAPVVREAFTAQVRRAAKGMAALAGDAEGGEDRALALLASMAGAVMLARAVDDPALSDRILAASRAFLHDAVGE